MSTCRIAPKFIMGIVSKAKRQGWTDDQLIEYCNSKGYNAEEVLNWKNKKDSGVVERTAPVIPVVTQVSRFDGYVSKEDDKSNNMLSYYSEFPEQHIAMKKEFEHDVLSRTYVDITADQVFKNPNKYIPGKGNLLNDELRKLKIEYINQLLGFISDVADVSGFKIEESDSNELKLKKYNAALQLAWDSMNALKDNDNYKRIINLYVKAKYFDNLIETIPFIDTNNEFKNIFDNSHYSFVDGKVKHFTGITSEDASTEDQISNIANILINYIPESIVINSKIKYIPNTSIGLDAFLSIISRFKDWIYSHTSTNNAEDKELKDFLVSEWRKGVNADFGEMMKLWVNKSHVGSLEKQKVNTIINVIFGKDSSGKYIAPNNIRDDFSQLIRSTITSSYVEVAYEIDEEGSKLVPKTLTERRYLTLKNEYQNYIIASSLILSQNPELRNNLFKKDLKTGDDYISFLGDLLYLQLPDFNSFDQDNKIANPTKDSKFVLKSVIDLIEELSKKPYKSDAKFIKEIKNHLSEDSGIILNFVKAISLSSKASFKSVIKNSEGNYLPLRQLPSLAYGLNNMFLDVTKLGLDKSSNNVIINNIANVKSPLVRSTTINSDGNTTQFRRLTATEMLQEAIEADFIYNLNNPTITEQGKEEYIIRLQSNCFSDKATNTVLGFNISKPWFLFDGNKNGEYKYYNIRKELLNVMNGNLNSEKLLLNIWRHHWFLEIKNEYETLANDYRTIFGWTGSDKEIIAKFNEWGKIHSEKDLIKAAYGKVDVIKNVHYIGGETLQFNPIIQGLIEMLSNKSEFDKYYQKLLSKFGNAPQRKAYLLAHQIFAESYNRAMFGNYYGHDIKAKAIYDDNNKISNLDELISSAWTSQTKRLAIVGATYHPYALGKEMGVADRMNIAVIKDEKAYVVNNNGELDDSLDSKDGSGDASPFFSRQANVSLGTAAAGANKKTIWHFYDYKHNTAGMLKWAEYEITNERMRDSWNSPTKEFIKFKKMHSIPFTSEQKSSLANIVDGFTQRGANSLYGKYKKVIYRDYNTGEYRTINSFNLIYNNDDDTLIGIVNDGTDQIYNIENIFDLFKMLGGPWCYTTDTAGKYIGSESNLDIINEIICKFGLKMNFIAYAVNASGMKTGIKNINETEVLTNDDDLMYFTEDVQYGGLQMDADHTLEEAESTEPSQMIGHVGQDGTSHAKIKKIYNSLSKEISIELADYVEALETKDKARLAELVGKSIVSSFERGDRDTISLAQKFISHASKTGDYNLPFDSSSINSIFTSTLFSDFTKKSAKRKYQGVGAVLNPSYNSKMYYNIGRINYKFDQVYNMIQNFIKDKGWQEYITVDQMLKDPYIYVPTEDGSMSWVMNPYMSEEMHHVDQNTGMIIEDNPIEFGNEYIIHYESLETGEPQFKKIKIETIEDYLKYRHGYVINNYGNIKITRNTLAPSNLRGIDATYTIEFNNGLYKVSQIENPYNLAMLHKNGKINLDKLISSFEDIDEDILDVDLTLALLKKAKEYARVYDKEGKMTYKYNENKRPDIISESTIDAIRNGERTATTRYIDDGHIEYWNSLKIGDIVKFSNNNGDVVFVKVTKPLTKLDETTSALEWSLKEGWSEDYFNTHVKPKINSAYQFEFEYIGEDITYTNIRNSQKTFFNNLKLEDSFFDLGIVKNIYVRPTEIMIGRMYAKELGLLPSDNISDIQGPEFFLSRFYDYYSTNENPDTNSYDTILFDGSGKKLYVKIDPNLSSVGFLDNDDFKVRDGSVYHDSKEVCKEDGKKFKKFVDANGNIHDYVIVDNVDRIQEIKKNNYDYSYNNLNANNFALFGYLNEGRETIARYVKLIRQNEEKKLNRYLHNLAKSKFFAFKKSLNFVGTRIPCQSMQSFTPMRVVAFTDSDNNEIYIPTHEQWVEGSDYDRINVVLKFF